MFIVSTIIFLVLTLMAMKLAGGAGMYADTVSGAIVLLPALAFTFAATSWPDVMRAVSLLFGNKTGLQQDVYSTSRRVFNLLGNIALLLGFFTTLIGAVAIASNTGPAEFTQVIGPAVGVCLLTLLYALAIKVVCYAAEHKVQSLADKA